VTTPAVPEPTPPNGNLAHRGVLPSGRTVLVRVDGRGEAIEVRSATGEMELRIALTDQGPVLSLRGARLEIDAADTVAVNCRRFEVRTTGGVMLDAAGDIALRSGAETQLRSAGDTYIDGQMVKLNCQDRAKYPDAPAPTALPAQTPTAGHDNCCGADGARPDTATGV
jgi:hypothetical protein